MDRFAQKVFNQLVGKLQSSFSDLFSPLWKRRAVGERWLHVRPHPSPSPLAGKEVIQAFCAGSHPGIFQMVAIGIVESFHVYRVYLSQHRLDVYQRYIAGWCDST